jgi:acetoin utilization protein AcuB
MQVREHMSAPAIVVSPETPVARAMEILRSRRIGRLPVVADGKLVGIVSEPDLLRAMPSPATSLTVWEMPELLERLPVREVMTPDVVVVEPVTRVQDAAQLMVDRRIGGLPVVEDGRVVGIITETDVFRVLVAILNGATAAV